MWNTVEGVPEVEINSIGLGVSGQPLYGRCQLFGVSVPLY